MKQLKSRLQDLRALFEQGIAVRHVAENLQSCRDDEDASSVRQRMAEDRLDFDVIGVRNNKSVVYGYAERSSLGTGKCQEYALKFGPSELVAESMPLLDLLPLLRDRPRVFVLEGNQVNGIVTRGDLQKAPVRMFLFGLVTLLEMNLLRLIRFYYPEDSWKDKSLVGPSRLKEAQELLRERKERNEAINLADCLQFCDKRDIIIKSPEIVKRIWSGSKASLESMLKSAEKKVRDKLAHGQDLVTGYSWPEIIDLAGKWRPSWRNWRNVSR